MLYKEATPYCEW